jgi:nuclear pore complex protein Nup107
MLGGWKLHHDPNMDMQYSDELGQVEGNDFRDIWKTSCWKMLDEPAYDVYEKAIFAALSGNVAKVLPACHTWYDHVWAYFKTLVDVQVEKALRSRITPPERDLVELPSKYWTNVLLPHQIFQEIEASPSADIRRQCQTHFHVIQKFIILDDMNGLVDEMCSWLQARPSIHRLRFMAHIGLVVRGLGRVREESKVNAILEAYVKALTDGHYQSAVALYAAQLPTDAQVNSYAYLLAGVQQEDQQRHCLQLGKEAGLDIAMVTKAVVENIRDREMDGEVCAASVELGQEVQLTELDLSKIKAINWLVHEEAQRAEAVRQGNALIRQFLTARKFSAAKAVFEKIPADSAQLITRLWQHKAGVSPLPPHIASDLTELQAICTYLEAKEAFSAWFQHFHHKKPAAPPAPTEGVFHEQVVFEHSLAQYELECEQWRLQASFLTEEASSKLYGVLVFPGGWMSAPSEAGTDEALSQQLQALRQTCIPEVCFLLHSVLHSSSLFKKCLQISDVITSEKYMIYKDFRPNELRQLLMLLQRSAVSLTSDPASDEMGYLVA